MTIEEFIRARLDEDERIARESDSGDGQWGFDERFDHVGTSDETVHSLHHSEHIARHDPARVLRDIAGKRKILAKLADAGTPVWWWHLHTNDILTAMAQRWADHPDYLRAWEEQE
ncbi:DUF6221 family protein [Nocardia sp. NPDC058640]|uniref:DUF6221 family protein n=1 Tax=Nocardia sp. NPDC058640 TaxID=3346571 RepID=UPI003650D457